MPSPICYCEKWPIHEAKAGLFASASHILCRDRQDSFCDLSNNITELNCNCVIGTAEWHSAPVEAIMYQTQCDPLNPLPKGPVGPSNGAGLAAWRCFSPVNSTTQSPFLVQL